ncbi:MAG: hypothetical protein ACI94Y_003877 [Maribacter sp.]|jgi:hypothetical protein
MNHKKNIQLIPYCIKCIEREKKVRIIAFSIVLVVGLLLVISFLDKNPAFIIIGMMMAAAGLKFLSDSIRVPKSSHHPIIQCLSFHPQKIVWIYAIKVDNMPFGIRLFSYGRLAIKLDDRTELSISLPYSDINLILQELQQQSPYATFGFSPENRQLYLIDPCLLLKD